MNGYVDLHLHYVPGVDDGVRDDAEAVALLRGLRALGFERAIATPHIRAGMFPNRRSMLEPAFDALVERLSATDGLPALGLGAEHFVDDSLPDLLENGETRAYPGGRAMLLELHPTTFPVNLAHLCFRIRTKGHRVVLAHPERYAPLFDRTNALDPLLDAGVLPLLDLMSLVGRYGRATQRAAERMLEEGVYAAACSDSHRPADLDAVRDAMSRLQRSVGRDEASYLLGEGPRRILDGTAEP